MKFSARRLLAAFLLACEFAAFPAAAQTVFTLQRPDSAPQFVAVNANKTVFVTDTTSALSALFLVNGQYTTTPTAFDTNFTPMPTVRKAWPSATAATSSP